MYFSLTCSLYFRQWNTVYSLTSVNYDFKLPAPQLALVAASATRGLPYLLHSDCDLCLNSYTLVYLSLSNLSEVICASASWIIIPKTLERAMTLFLSMMMWWKLEKIEMKRTVDQRLSLQHPPFSTWQGEFVKFSTAIQYYLTNYMIHILYVYGAVFLSI